MKKNSLVHTVDKRIGEKESNVGVLCWFFLATPCKEFMDVTIAPSRATPMDIIPIVFEFTSHIESDLQL